MAQGGPPDKEEEDADVAGPKEEREVCPSGLLFFLYVTAAQKESQERRGLEFLQASSKQ